MDSKSRTFPLLSALSAIFLSSGFLFPHCGGIALFSLVPLLWMDREASRRGCRRFFWWYYLTFVLWNALTTFWVCNATVGGGIAAVLANAFLMSLIWALFRLSKKRFNGVLPYLFLAVTWIAWERFFFDAEISWPWLTLGNAFAYSTTCIQWYEYTGTLGGSLWIWCCNLAIFGLLCAITDGNWKQWNVKARIAASVGTTLLFIVPLALSWTMYAGYSEKSEGTIQACAIQPNLDPYEKFESLTQDQQNAIFVDLMAQASDESDKNEQMLFVLPETATSDISLNRLNDSPTIFTLRKSVADRPNTNILFGASTYQFFHSSEAPSYTARQSGSGVWYENYNTALMIDCSPRVELYHKSRLVIGVEKIPYPKYMSKVENLLGGGLMGHCIGQEKAGLLNFIQNDSTGFKCPMGCAVCYESVYPEYFASYVREGAKAMAVITNDAWWGNTPGYRQHLRYSCLRAIETRRDIVRCANTGISAFIDQKGDIVSASQWWTRCCLKGKVNLSSELTAYVRYGDVTGRICTFLFLLILASLLVSTFTNEHNNRLYGKR